MNVQRYLRTVAAQGRETEVVGPFRAYFNPAYRSEGSNYAIPVDGAAPSAEDVAALVDAFTARGCRPRLEYLPEVAPGAEAALLAGGFDVELRTVVMTCAPDERVPPPVDPAVSVEALGPGTGDDVLLAVLEVQAEGFGDPSVDPARLELARRWLGRWSTVLARVDGEPAGAGMSLDVHEGSAELVGIATRERFRRRGIAGAVTAELARLVHARGAVTAFLTPGGPDAGRVYARAGFTARGEMLHLRR